MIMIAGVPHFGPGTALATQRSPLEALAWTYLTLYVMWMTYYAGNVYERLAKSRGWFNAK